MNIFFWRKNRIIDIFATTLANELYSTVTPAMATEYFLNQNNNYSKKTNKTQKNIDSYIIDVTKQVKSFKKSNSLGIYGKARLHLKFKIRLEELGYSPDVANRINEYILLNTP